MNLLDIHTHVMPGIDDGAANLEQSLDMLRNAQASHVAAVVATPHCNIPGFCQNVYDEDFLQNLRQLRTAAQQAQIDVQILAGMEVRVNDALLSLLHSKKVLTLNGSRYLLTEFAPDAAPGYCIGMLKKILSLGYTPVIAHPERYGCVWQRPDCVDDWLALGCHTQVTGGSLLGKFGMDAKRTADILLERDWVTCIASDAHGVLRRTNYLMDVADYLTRHYSADHAQRLLQTNPLRICQNELL